MLKKIILVLVVAVFFCGFKLASAEVIINEVAWMGTEASQYEEWIELKNNGSESVNLSNWKLYKSEDRVLFSLSGTISAGEYYLVCRTTNSVPNPLSGICNEQGPFGGSGLNNTNDILELKNENETRQDFIDASSGSGWPAGDSVTKETMQKLESNWITASPTPKAQNASSGNDENNNGDPEPEDSGTNTGSGSSSEPADETPVIVNPTMKAKVLANKIAFVGIPLDIENSILGYSNENIRCGRYFWNFGDGDSLETTSSEKFLHTYFYPGEYVITLDYYKTTSFLTGEPDAVNKITVKVAPLTVSISNVGDEKDFFVELTNNSDYDIDISKWELTSSTGRTFIFPRNSVIPTKKKITLSPKITGFTIADKNDLKLITLAGDIAFNYNILPEPIVIPEKVAKVLAQAPVIQKNKPAEIENEIVPEIEIPVSNENIFENLPASPILSNQNTENSNSNFPSYLLWIGLIVFLGVGAGVVYFLRHGRNNGSAQIRNNSRSNIGNDFGILDE